MRERAARLTITVNRSDLSRTNAGLFAPTTEYSATPPDNACIQVGESR
jgi:hypothetical protein